MTVEADPVRVESRLAAGQVDCPGCPGVLRPWGWARPRGVHGIGGVLRPRRARCGACLVTHVLLPVTVLLRRAYAAEVIGAALLARAGGAGSPLDRGGAGGSGGDGAGLAAGDGRRGWTSARVHLLQVAAPGRCRRHGAGGAAAVRGGICWPRWVRRPRR